MNKSFINTLICHLSKNSLSIYLDIRINKVGYIYSPCRFNNTLKLALWISSTTPVAVQWSIEYKIIMWHSRLSHQVDVLHTVTLISDRNEGGGMWKHLAHGVYDIIMYIMKFTYVHRQVAHSFISVHTSDESGKVLDGSRK